MRHLTLLKIVCVIGCILAGSTLSFLHAQCGGGYIQGQATSACGITGSCPDGSYCQAEQCCQYCPNCGRGCDIGSGCSFYPCLSGCQSSNCPCAPNCCYI